MKRAAWEGAQAPKASEVVMPNDALRALRSQVEQLGIDHPRRSGVIGLDSRLDQALPWIGRTLEKAASALESAWILSAAGSRAPRCARAWEP
jgi:hypothetical protein